MRALFRVVGIFANVVAVMVVALMGYLMSSGALHYMEASAWGIMVLGIIAGLVMLAYTHVRDKPVFDPLDDIIGEDEDGGLGPS